MPHPPALEQWTRIRMAIETVRKIALVAPAAKVDALQQRLYDLALLHVTDAFETLGENPEDALFRKPAVDTQHVERILHNLLAIESVFELCVHRKKSFIESFAPIPERVTPGEMAEHLAWDGLGALHDQARALGDALKEQQHCALEMAMHAEDLRLFLQLPFDVRHLAVLTKFGAALGRIPLASWSELMRTEAADRLLMGQLLIEQDKQAVVVVAWRAEQESAALELLRPAGFVEIQIPPLEQHAAERYREVEAAMHACQRREIEIRNEIIALESKWRRRVNVLLAHWEGEHQKLLARNHIAVSSRLAVVTGYVRVRDMKRLRALLSQEFPTVALMETDPSPGEAVPVSLRSHPLVRPGEIMIGMFGLPDYFAFDPTPFVIAVFVSFFGICFGDAVYGLGLIAFSAWMMHKYRQQPVLRNFFHLFIYCGITTALVGVFTGAWMGDIYKPEYLGAGNPLLRLVNWMTARGLILDPMKKPMTGLVVALGIGVFAQLYGIALKMYGAARRGRWAEAVFDGGLWFLAIPGILILISTMFGKPPAALVAAGKVMLAVSVVGLVLTQGRHEKGLFGKATTGLVSVYGILGSYGCVTFIGDMLSYSRLLALGLTTSVLAFVFNTIGGMVKSYGLPGIALFLLILVLGHTFNFLVSMLGGFVHSTRLLFLEMFGRFYEMGGHRFKPLGFSSPRIQIVPDSQDR